MSDSIKTLWEGKFKLLKIVEKNEEGEEQEIIRFDSQEFDILKFVDELMKLPENFRDTVLLGVIGELERLKIDLITIFTDAALKEDEGGD